MADSTRIKLFTLTLAALATPAGALSVKGGLEALEELRVRPKIAGTVLSVKTSLHAQVSEGQVLAVLDARALAAETEQAGAQAGLTGAVAGQTGAQSADAKKMAERRRRLEEIGAETQAEVGIAEDRALILKEDAEEAEEKAKGAQVRYIKTRGALRRAEIVSLVDGWVTELSVEAGQTVVAGVEREPLLTLAEDLGKLRMRAALTRPQASDLKEGQPVKFAVERFPGMAFSGVAAKIKELPGAAGAPPLFEADLRVDNPGNLLWPGDKAEASWGEDAGMAKTAEELDPSRLAARPKAFTDQDLAVVIGIEEYQNLPPSEYSRSDAQTLKRYLLALGMREGNIQLLLDEKATFSAVTKVVETWLANKLREGGRVVVYFSGHGAPEPASGDAYWVPWDGDPNYLKQTGYPLKRLYEKLGALKAREVIVLLDSCFSGSGGRSVLARGARPLVLMAPPPALGPEIAVFSAARAAQISSSSPAKRHGVFTWHFLRSLEAGKRSLTEIHDAVAPAVEDEARSLNVEQNPELVPPAEAAKGRFLF